MLHQGFDKKNDLAGFYFVCFVAYHPSQQLWSCPDDQLT